MQGNDAKRSVRGRSQRVALDGLHGSEGKARAWSRRGGAVRSCTDTRGGRRIGAMQTKASEKGASDEKWSLGKERPVCANDLNVASGGEKGVWCE